QAVVLGLMGREAQARAMYGVAATPLAAHTVDSPRRQVPGWNVIATDGRSDSLRRRICSQFAAAPFPSLATPHAVRSIQTEKRL
ncbi:MAG: hypothetical protein KDA61_23180, partial [Planctomycetales bacterium]|nr:hypothetical protein [Planctomycetales bacterium]